jgi:transcriptional regulator with XRE-family HTH domain
MIIRAGGIERLARFIEEKRSSKGLSQRELAKIAGISFGTIQNLENAATQSPGLDVIEKLSKALNEDPRTLFSIYLGLDPNEKGDYEKDFVLKNAVKAFLSSLPETVIYELIKSKTHLYEQVIEIDEGLKNKK